jgi:hypothetical protein
MKKIQDLFKITLISIILKQKILTRLKIKKHPILLTLIQLSKYLEKILKS